MKFVVDRREHYDVSWAVAANARRSFTEAAKLAHELVAQDGVPRNIFEYEEGVNARWRLVARIRPSTSLTLMLGAVPRR